MGLFTSTPNYMEGDLSAQQARKAVDYIRQIDDPARLADIARDAKDSVVRAAAIRQLEDAVLLTEIAIADESGKVGEICVREKISDPVLLGRIALEARCGSVRLLAARHAYLNDQALLERIALKDTDIAVRTAAVENTALNDPDALARIATTARDEFLEPGWMAALKLSRRFPDRAAPMLIELLKNEVAWKRVTPLNETLEFLSRYLRQTDDPSMKEAIESILKRAGRL